jgi:hypothetical protein
MRNATYVRAHLNQHFYMINSAAYSSWEVGFPMGESQSNDVCRSDLGVVLTTNLYSP